MTDMLFDELSSLERKDARRTRGGQPRALATLNPGAAESLGLPAKHALRYHASFVHRFLACVFTVSWKLWDVYPHRPACLAEELALHGLIRQAEASLDIAGNLTSLDDLRDVVFEDEDFELLFDPTYDGIEEDEGIMARVPLSNLAFRQWSEPWHSRWYVHPYLKQPRLQRITAAADGDAEDDALEGTPPMPVATLKRLMRGSQEGDVRAWTFDRDEGFSPNVNWRQPGDDPTPEQQERGVIWHTDDELRLNHYQTDWCMALGDTGKDGAMLWVYASNEEFEHDPTSYAVNLVLRNHVETVVCPTYPDLLAYLHQVTPMLNLSITTAQRAEEIEESQDGAEGAENVGAHNGA
jgi:hypothetical protein